MLFWRAFSRAKVIFADVLKGVRLPHEIEDEVAGLGFENARNVTTAPAAPDLGGPADNKRQAVRREIQKARETVKNGGTKEPAAGDAKTEKTSQGESRKRVLPRAVSNRTKRGSRPSMIRRPIRSRSRSCAPGSRRRIFPSSHC
jgi:hypothetical protein